MKRIDSDRLVRHLNDIFLTNAPNERTDPDNRDYQKGICKGLEYAMETIREHEHMDAEPRVLTPVEIFELPRLSIVFIECWDGEYQAPLPTIMAGMKCYDGTIVDEDGSIFSHFEDDMTKDHFDGSCWRFWSAMPTEEQRKEVKWDE